MRVTVIGGGIAGLATAYFLLEHARAAGRSVKLTLFERSAGFGGKVISERRDGFVIEGGPDSFLTQKPAALQLCHSLGLDSQLIGTNEDRRKTFIWSKGSLRALPDGLTLIVPTRMLPFVRSPLLSWPGKLRMGLDLVIPRRRSNGDESLASFVRRRLGQEALDRLAEPMIAGIYAADAERLSLQSTFPHLLDLEQRYGSLIRGMLAQRRRAATGGTASRTGQAPFMTLRGGLATLIEVLVARLQADGAMLVNTQAQTLRQADSEYLIYTHDGSCIAADAVVFATPAYVTAELLRPLAPAAADALGMIRYVSTVTISLGFRSKDLNHPLDGFGFVVPRNERRRILACTWSSSKFADRAPAGHSLIRAFIGGSRAEQFIGLDDDTLVDLVREELRLTMGLTAAPVLERIFRWRQANPQYDVGHADRVATIEGLVGQLPGLYLVGSAYHGIGLPDCIQNGKRVANLVLGGTP